jgi:hypothetical protein
MRCFHAQDTAAPIATDIKFELGRRFSALPSPFPGHVPIPVSWSIGGDFATIGNSCGASSCLNIRLLEVRAYWELKGGRSNNYWFASCCRQLSKNSRFAASAWRAMFRESSKYACVVQSEQPHSLRAWKTRSTAFKGFMSWAASGHGMRLGRKQSAWIAGLDRLPPSRIEIGSRRGSGSKLE